MARRYGTIETGGTKTSCAVGSTPTDLEALVTFPTTTPSETLERVIKHLSGRDLDAVGISSFGPVELRKNRPDYGHVTTTPKEGWSHTAVVGPIREALAVPIGFDTDVNGAALGEGRWGAGRGLSSFVYVTVGTGIGGGALVEGEPLHGLVHPEMGHMIVRRHPEDDFPGACRVHGDCLEGLAAGPSLEERFGSEGEHLTGDDLARAVRFEGFYLGQLVRNLVYVLAPERVILGGGVSEMPGLIERTRACLEDELAGYPGLPEHRTGFVVAPGLGPLPGLAGGIILAEEALDS